MAEKKDKDLAVREVSAITFSIDAFAELATKKGEAILGLENLGREDIVMPKIKLLQATSMEVSSGKAKPGQFFNLTTDEVLDTVDDIVLLCLGHSRIKFQQPFKRGAQPLCRSFDGICSTDGVVCKTCKDCDWNSLEEGQTKPACNMGYTWLAVKYDENGNFGVPFRFIVSGAGVSELKKFITTLSTTGYPPFIFRAQISSEQKTSDQGVYFIPKFAFKKTESGDILTINPKLINKLKPMVEQWTSMLSSIAEQDSDSLSEDIAETETEGAMF